MSEDVDEQPTDNMCRELIEFAECFERRRNQRNEASLFNT